MEKEFRCNRKVNIKSIEIMHKISQLNINYSKIYSLQRAAHDLL
jgi:hypothetical protein